MKLFKQPARLLLILLVCVMPCFAQSGKSSDAAPPPPALESDPKAWEEFWSAEGRFAVLLPATMTGTVHPIETKFGKADLHLFSARIFVAVYNVMYIDFQQSVEEMGRVKELLNDGRDGGVKNVNGQLLEEKDITIDKHVGRFVKVRAANGNIVRSRMYVVKNRLYAVTITMREDGAPDAIAPFHEEAAAKYLGSFKLTSEQSGWTRVEYGDMKGQTATADPKGEVDELLKSLRERNELVIAQCSDSIPCPPTSQAKSAGERLKGEVNAGRAISKPQPEYPLAAKYERAFGTIKVKVIIDEDGRVIATQVSEYPHQLLLSSSIKAARNTLFKPTLLNGKPVKVMGWMVYKFHLQ